jgi:1A family penicillin-binding protein
MRRRLFLHKLRRNWRDLTAERAWLAIGIALVLTLFVFVFSWERCFFDGCPDVASLAAYQPGGAPVLLDRHGEVFADLTPVAQQIVPLHTLPSHVAQAFLAVEDQRFHEHHGIDLQRVAGAVVANLRAGDFEQGFSTITMQVARNIFPERIPGQERSLARKLTEIRVAKEIEQRYSKEEILELYLNHIYFGNRAHGIEAAAQQYFGISAQELTLPQAALLAALPKAPSHYDPRRHPEDARERRDLVLNLMERQKRVPRLMAQAARSEPVEVVPPPRHIQTESGLAPHFVEQVRRELEEMFGPGLYRQPLRVRTTLDSRTQRAAEEELSRQLRRLESGELGAFEGPRYSADAEPEADGTPYLQGAVVVLDTRNGDVLGWVGGRNFAHSQFDRAAQARRQPGSAFKPFVYAAALRDGWALSQPLLDRPLALRLADGRIWKPRNFTNQYEGEVTVRDALVRSKNVATVRLATAVGLGEVAEEAQLAGLEEPRSAGPAMALGSVAVSPLELTSAYTAFASLGTLAEPRWLLAIEDADGRVLWSSEARRRKVLDPGVAYLITDVLGEALERGTGYRVRQSGVRVPAAGKTGTTNDGADAWFVGYTPEVAAGIWIGFDKPQPIVDDATGGKVAAPLWANIVRRAHAGRPLPKPWAKPKDVVEHPVDPGSGLILKQGCTPVRGQARRELFLEDALPAAWCPGKEPRPRPGFPSLARKQEEVQRAEAQADQERIERVERQRREQERLAKLQEQEQDRLERQREEMERQAREREAKAKAEVKAEAERLSRLRQEKQEEQQQTLAQQRKEQEERKKEEESAKQAREREEQERREERQARLREQEERERRLREREAELRKAEEKLSRQREERTRKSDPESEVADVEVEEPERSRQVEEEKEKKEEEEEDEEASSDLSGWWELTNRIQATQYKDYIGLRLGYRIKLEQDGNRITGRGQKSTEDGRSLSGSARSPIRVTGSLDGDTLSLEFTEQGARRSSGGGFTLRLSADRTTLRGSFWSDVAGTKGSTLARRMP